MDAVGSMLDHFVEIHVVFAFALPVEAGGAMVIVGLHRRRPASDQVVVPPDPAIGIPGRKFAKFGAAVVPEILVGLVIGELGILFHDSAEEAGAMLID